MDQQRINCILCGTIVYENEYLPSHNRFHHHNHLPVCNKCLLKDYNSIEENEVMNWMDALCQEANIPFDIERWDQVYKANQFEAPIAYVLQYAIIERPKENNWKAFEERYRAILNTPDDYTLTKTTMADKARRLVAEWGNSYTDEELIKLDKFYQNLVASYGVSNPTVEDTGRKLCRMSIEIDRTIASGAQGIDKLINAYSKLQEMGGFKTEQAHDYNAFESISELTMYMEKIGWKNKFDNNEPQDIIDFTMRDIQLHNKRLYTNETTISDQIDNRLSTKARIDAIEQQIVEDEIEDLDSTQYDTSSIDWEQEDFNPNM